MGRRKKIPTFRELAGGLGGKVNPPYGVVPGSPNEVIELVAALPGGDVTCYQMDLHQSARIRAGLDELGVQAAVETLPDLWDIPTRAQTLLYPVALGGERALKLDMIEQAYHALR